MFVAVTKISFDEAISPYDGKELKSLCESIKSGLGGAYSYQDKLSGQYCVITTCLDYKQEKLSQKLDRVSAFCRNLDLGGFLLN